MTALAWLNDLVQWFGRWVPRLVLIEPTHRGVRFGPRGSAREVGPGLIVYWPITHGLVRVPVTTQSTQLSAQVLPHADGAEIIPRIHLCAAAVQFRVTDPVRAATRSLNVHAVIDNRSQAAIARHVGARSDRDHWAQLVVADLRSELDRFGVEVERLDFVNQGTGVALKNIADWNYTDNLKGERAS